MSGLGHALTKALSGYSEGTAEMEALKARAEALREQRERQKRLDDLEANYKNAQIGKLNAEAQAPQKPEPFNAVKARAERIKELVAQGTKLEDAVKQARLEQGEVDTPRPDPVAVHAAQRDYDISHPLPHSEGSEPLVKVNDENGNTVFVPRSQAAGKTAPQGNQTPTEGERKVAGLLASIEPDLAIIKAYKPTPNQIAAKGGKLGQMWARRDPQTIRAVQAAARLIQNRAYAVSGATVRPDEAEEMAWNSIPYVWEAPEVQAAKLKSLEDMVEGVRVIAGRAVQSHKTETPPSKGGSVITLKNGKKIRIPD